VSGRRRRRRPRVTVNVAATAFEWRAIAVTARVVGWREAIPHTTTVRPVSVVAGGCSPPPPPRRPPVQQVSTAIGSGGLQPPRCPRAAVGGGGAACAGIVPSGRGYCRRARGGGARPPPLPAAARKTCQDVMRAPPPLPRARNAVAFKDDACDRFGAAGGALAGARADLSGSIHTRGHGTPRLCPHQKVQTQYPLLPAPPGARLVQELGAARAARGAAGADGRPWGVSPATDAPGDTWQPPATMRGITRSHPHGGHLPPHNWERTTRPWRCWIPSGGGGTRRVYHPLDEAASAGPWQPWVNPPATGPPTGRRQRACGVLPPSPLPTASHSAAEVAEAALAAVAVVTMVSTAMVEGAPAAIRRPSGQEWQWQWRRPRRCRQQWRQRPSCRLWQCNWRCRQLAAAAPMAVAADMTVLAMALAAA